MDGFAIDPFLQSHRPDEELKRPGLVQRDWLVAQCPYRLRWREVTVTISKTERINILKLIFNMKYKFYVGLFELSYVK